MARDQQLEERVTALVAPVVAREGVELVEVEVRGARGSRVVRVLADHDEGLGLDRVTTISRRVEEVLDEADPVPGRYTLEVSSPGVDRPLTTASQLRRNVGRDLHVVRTRGAIDRGERGEVTGTLLALDGDELVLDVDGEQHRVPRGDVERARVQLPW